MRSRAEIAFRLRQELGNAAEFLRRPRLPRGAAACVRPALPNLPDPEAVAAALRGTAFAHEVERLAESVLRHRFPLLGLEIETGPGIAWRRDYVNGRQTGLDYFRRIPYLDFDRVGDHKIVWELNRHQHLVLLAQAFRLTGRPGYLREIVAQLESWLEQNPYLRGINWASALEVAFRALSWAWVFHLAGESFDSAFRGRFLEAIWLHGRYLARNLSVYFSPNTHLLGEAVALHTLGILLKGFPETGKWEGEGARIVREQMHFQVREDGSHFEQSTYYHVYALDFFLFDAQLAPPPPGFRAGLERMGEYLAAVLGESGSLPFLGDDDGGRLFHPFGPRERFGRATLATAALSCGRSDWPCDPEDVQPQAAWWIGPRALERARPSAARPASCRLFPAAGLAVMEAGGVQVIADAGPFGHGGAGHSHSDTLSVIVRHGCREVLIDPGTYTYTADAHWREWFRGSQAHNTLAVAEAGQAAPTGPFRWTGKPAVEVKRWDAALRFLDAVCAYRSFVHRRKTLLLESGLLVVLDSLAGPAEPVLVEQFWHLGMPAEAAGERGFRIGEATLALAGGGGCRLYEGGPHGWRAPAYGCKVPAPVVHVTWRGLPPARFAAVLAPAPIDAAGLRVEESAGSVEVFLDDRRLAIFPAEGPAVI